MIQSFKDGETRKLFETGSSKRWASIRDVANRKLDQLETAVDLSDLRFPSGNRLEALKRDRAGQHSIRVNDQYRICFVWKVDGAYVTLPSECVSLNRPVLGDVHSSPSSSRLWECGNRVAISILP
jgi:proteic killer suppression protein